MKAKLLLLGLFYLSSNMTLRLIYTFHLICLLWITLTAQNENSKHDYQWLVGLGAYDSITYKGMLLDFHGDSLEIFQEQTAAIFNISSVSMADKDGNLVFSSNNDVVMNGNNEIMVNGDSLNAGGVPYNVDYYQQSQLALPAPGSDSLYYLFHQEYSFVGDVEGLYIVPFKMLYSTIDLSFDENSGFLGKVLDKNVSFLEDTIMMGHLTAVRHANGRDWWMISKKLGTNLYYKYLLDPIGLQDVRMQTVGELPWPFLSVGQALFNPNGNIYATVKCRNYTVPYHLDVFSFNRCIGDFIPIQRVVLNAGNYPGGLAFSPNSRFLYYADAAGYYRIDTDQDSLTLEFLQPRIDTVKFGFQAQLGPDGKIYYALGLGTTQHYAVIDNPDEENPDSVVIRQQGLALPNYNNGTIPHHPNYRLGRLAGSPCDTLTFPTDVAEPVSEAESPDLQIAPNPAWAQTTVTGLPSKETDLILTDISGRECLRTRVSGPEAQLDVGELPAGVYVVRVAGRKPARLVVVRE